MDYSLVLEKYYKNWSIIDNSYNTIVFEEGDKPTDEHLKNVWEDMLIDIMREERNQLLKESD